MEKKQKLNELYKNLGSLYELRQKGDLLQAKLEFENSNDLLKDKGFYNAIAHHFPTNEGNWKFGIDKTRFDYLSASLGTIVTPLNCSMFKPGVYIRNEKPKSKSMDPLFDADSHLVGDDL